METEGRHIIADRGKVFVRRETGENYGTEIYLGYSHYIGGERVIPPHYDVPEDFDEINVSGNPPANQEPLTEDNSVSD